MTDARVQNRTHGRSSTQLAFCSSQGNWRRSWWGFCLGRADRALHPANHSTGCASTDFTRSDLWTTILRFEAGVGDPSGLRRNIIDYWCGKSYHIFGCRLDTSRGESDHIRNQTSTSDLGPPPFGTRGNQLECEISHGREIPLAC